MVRPQLAGIFVIAQFESLAMVSEQEVRACKHAFMQPAHPAHWGRAVGALMSYAAFFVLLTVGGLVASNTNRTATVNTPTPNAIAATTAQVPAVSVSLQTSAD